VSNRLLYFTWQWTVVLCMLTTPTATSLQRRSRSFKVMNFRCNPKPMYDFVLVINCTQDLSRTVSQICRCEVDRKPPHPSLSPRSREPSNFVIKLGRKRAKASGYVSVKLHGHDFSRFITIHSRHRQTDKRQYGTCNAIATFH